MKSILRFLIPGLAALLSTQSSAADPDPPAPPPADRIVTLTGKARFEASSDTGNESDRYYTFITDAKAGNLHFWVPDITADVAKPLASPKELRIELREQEWAPPRTSGEKAEPFKTQTLSKLFDGDKLIFDASVCPLHHTAMTRQLVPVHYGIVGYNAGPRMKAEYPHAAIPISAGCIVMSGRRSEWIWVCPDCEKKRQEINPDPAVKKQ